MTYDWTKLISCTQFDVIMMDPPWQLATANPTRGETSSLGTFLILSSLDGAGLTVLARCVHVSAFVATFPFLLKFGSPGDALELP